MYVVLKLYKDFKKEFRERWGLISVVIWCELGTK